MRSRTPTEGLPDFVPASWTQFRTSGGHEAHVGHGKIECRDCHDFERDGFKNAGAFVCAKCHGQDLSAAHHRDLVAPATNCLSCHMFAPGQVEKTCIGCHDKPQGSFAAIAVHAKIDCAKCHELKGGASNMAVVGATCAGCHEERAPEHGGHASSKGCMDYHHGHEAAKQASATCASCHAEAAKPHPVAHDACISCHQPHTFVASQGKCIGCHGEKTTLVARLVPAHRECLDCHEPHAPARAAAACAKCHQDVRVQHGSAGACVNCHAPHGDDPVAVAVTCTSCHAKVARTDLDAHAGGIACSACHKAHDFGSVDARTVCQSCHARETSQLSPRTRDTQRVAACPATAPRLPTRPRRPRWPAPPVTPRSRAARQPGTSTASGVTSPTPASPPPRAPLATRRRATIRTGRSPAAARRATVRMAPEASRLLRHARAVTRPRPCPRCTRPRVTRPLHAPAATPRRTVARSSSGPRVWDATRTSATTTRTPRAARGVTCSSDEVLA